MVGQAQSHINNPKAQLPSPPNLSCLAAPLWKASMSLPEISGTMRGKWGRWCAKEGIVQCKGKHGPVLSFSWHKADSRCDSGWEQLLHSFLLLHTVHLITVGRWTPFARQTMGSGSSSKAFIAKWLNKLTAGAGRRAHRAPHFPPCHCSGCKSRCCTMGSQLSFCSSGKSEGGNRKGITTKNSST